MSVTMKGGPSGNRESTLPNVSVPFDRQIPENTASNARPNPDVKTSMVAENRHIASSEPPVPHCGVPNDAAV